MSFSYTPQSEPYQLPATYLGDATGGMNGPLRQLYESQINMARQGYGQQNLMFGGKKYRRGGAGNKNQNQNQNQNGPGGHRPYNGPPAISGSGPLQTGARTPIIPGAPGGPTGPGGPPQPQGLSQGLGQMPLRRNIRTGAGGDGGGGGGDNSGPGGPGSGGGPNDGGPGGPRISCFGGETLVKMADSSSKPISEVQVGDEVLGFDEHGGVNAPLVPGKVTQVHQHDPEDDLVVTTPKFHDGTLGREIVSTKGHHIFLPTALWVPIFRAKEAVDPDGKPVVLTQKAFEGKAEVWNLTVDGLATYIAGGIRVHNMKKSLAVSPPTLPVDHRDLDTRLDSQGNILHRNGDGSWGYAGQDKDGFYRGVNYPGGINQDRYDPASVSGPQHFSNLQQREDFAGGRDRDGTRNSTGRDDAGGNGRDKQSWEGQNFTEGGGDDETPEGGLYGLWNNMIEHPGYDDQTKTAINTSGMEAARSPFDSARGDMARQQAQLGNSAGYGAALGAMAQHESKTMGDQAMDNQYKFATEANRQRELGGAGMMGLYGMGQTSLEDILKRMQGINSLTRTPGAAGSLGGGAVGTSYNGPYGAKDKA